MSVNIRKMTGAEFGDFYRWTIENNADELMERNGMSREDALAESEKEVAEMLPHGMNTENNHLMIIEKDNSKETVGYIWTLHEETEGKKQSFLCDFVIFESQRRKGFAVEALDRMEKSASGDGCCESVLFVDNCNHAASALYEKCGYKSFRKTENGKYMKKQL